MFALLALVSALLGSTLAINHIVTVGQNGLTYTPSAIAAAIGDNVQFNFYALNHSVTQSTFENPCAALVNGFDSGFVTSARESTPSFINPERPRI